MGGADVAERRAAGTVIVQRTAAVNLLQGALQLILPLGRADRHGAGVRQILLLRSAGDGLVAEGVQRRRRDNVADAARIGSGIGIADVIGEVGGNVAAGLDDGAERLALHGFGCNTLKLVDESRTTAR